MTSTAISRASAEKLIWKACDELRGALPADQALEVVLDVLLWARWVPASDGVLIGYFDAMRSLANADEWSSIQKAIAERSGMTLSPSSSDEVNSSLNHSSASGAALLPVGRALNSGDRLQCKAVIEAMSELRSQQSQWWGAGMLCFHGRLLGSPAGLSSWRCSGLPLPRWEWQQPLSWGWTMVCC